jgi:regulator of replication initiation timing
MHESSGTAAAQSDEQLFERVIALEERVSELEADRERYREELHAVARENHELRSSHEQLEERIDDTEIEHNELQSELERAEASRGHIIEDIVDVEEQLADVETKSVESDNGNNAEASKQRTDMAPIERISVMDTDETGIDVTPSIERAVSIFEHWEEWSNKTPKGRVLKSNLKTLLRTATGEGLAWRQVYRAAEALDELSKGRIEFIDHSRHGKMLIESQPASNGDCRSSSAATG